MSRWWRVALAVSVAVPAIVLRLSGAHLAAPAAVPLFGLAVVAASFLLVWAAEAAQHDISGNLATAILAVIAVLPEYAVDLYFGWSAGHIPENARYAAANMTGSNRLLLWLGWPFVALLFAWGLRRRGEKPRGLELHEGRRVDLRFLGAASLYSLLIPFTRRLAWYDAVALLTLFGAYLWRAAQGKRTELELVGVAKQIGDLPRRRRRILVGTRRPADGGVHPHGRTDHPRIRGADRPASRHLGSDRAAGALRGAISLPADGGPARLLGRLRRARGGPSGAASPRPRRCPRGQSNFVVSAGPLDRDAAHRLSTLRWLPVPRTLAAAAAAAVRACPLGGTASCSTPRKPR